MQNPKTTIDGHRRAAFHRAAVGAMAAAAASVLFHWGWNKVAAGLFGLPAFQFADSLAALLAVGAVAATAGFAARLSGRRPKAI